jgi:predicted anti-sigma-YlaC factor YlaD
MTTQDNQDPTAHHPDQEMAHAGHDPCGHLGQLSDFIDGDLEPALCAQLESHLQECENCRVVVDTLQRTVSLYRDLDVKTDLAPDVEERLWRRFDLEDLLPLAQA